MAVTKRSATESEKKSPAKKRTLNNSNHSSEGDPDTLPAISSPSNRSPNKSKRKSENVVKFRNTLMISEYQEKNPHITVQNLDDESQFNADEITTDDDVWIFQAPASMDVSQLLGQTFKLGSRSSTVQVDDQSFECVTEKFSEPKGMSMICTQKNTQMALVSFVPKGKVVLRAAINGAENDEAIDFTGLETSVRVPIPDNLKVRHPLHGANYADLIKLDKAIRSKLEESNSVVIQKSRPKKMKRKPISDEELDAETKFKTEPISPKKKSRKRKLDSNHDDDEGVPKKAKIRIDTEDGNDLEWIKQL